MAVIKIKDSFAGHPFIRPVVLANEQCVTLPKMSVRLAGWGYNEHNVLPEELFEIQQYIIDNEKCYGEWGGDITSRYGVKFFHIYINLIFDLFMKKF